MSLCIAGAGAVGGYVAGRLAAAGHAVVVIDPWDRHVEAMRHRGLLCETPDDSIRVQIEALGVSDVQQLKHRRFDAAILCTKTYDTAWVLELILPFVAPTGCILSMQNGIMEPAIAARTGWSRVLGCVVGGMSTHLVGPGHVVRARRAAQGARQEVFRIGELHGAITPRAEQLARALSDVDDAIAITNLWGERWAKLTQNAMTSAISGISGWEIAEIFADEELVRLMTGIAAECITLGQALGYHSEKIMGLSPNIWLEAAAEDAEAVAQVARKFDTQRAGYCAGHVSGMAQDIRKGRMTEIADVNGFVVRQGRNVGLNLEKNRRVMELIESLERKEMSQERAMLSA